MKARNGADPQAAVTLLHRLHGDREIAEHLGLSPVTVRRWRTGVQLPREVNRQALKTLADRLHKQELAAPRLSSRASTLERVRELLLSDDERRRREELGAQMRARQALIFAARDAEAAERARQARAADRKRWRQPSGCVPVTGRVADPFTVLREPTLF